MPALDPHPSERWTWRDTGAGLVWLVLLFLTLALPECSL